MLDHKFVPQDFIDERQQLAMERLRASQLAPPGPIERDPDSLETRLENIIGRRSAITSRSDG